MATRRPDTFRLLAAQKRRAMQRKKPPKRRRALLAGCAMLLAGLAVAAVGMMLYQGDDEAPAEQLRGAAAPPRGVYWFQDDRFGVMITWGPASLTGKEISWSRGGGRPCDDSGDREDLLPRMQYDSLYYRFNPTNLDADAWAELLRRAGARYVVLVTKHHDGFCMFDTKLSEYKVTRSPYGRDITAELVDAFRRAGLRPGFYYSLPDWVQPDYCTTRHGEYVKYLHRQVRELCSDYGHIDIFWLDGSSLRAADWGAEALLETMHTLQPEALVNNQAGVPGDFDTHDEAVEEPELIRPWERRLMWGTQWSYKPDDTLKSASECLCELVRAVGRGGNLLLNVAPRPDGTFEPRQAEILLQMGAWLEQCGEGIYKTRPGPYWPTAAYVSTRRDRMVYLHLLERPNAVIDLPALGRKVVSCAMLGAGTVSADVKADRIQLSVEVGRGQEPPWTVRLELDAVAPAMRPK